MTRALVVDTSSWFGSVALVEGDGIQATVVHEIGDVVDGTHASSLIGWIDRAMVEAGWSRTQLDRFVAVRGPGSFTGLRIGLGTVVGLGLAADRPVQGVVGLQAMAVMAGPGETPRVPCLDAGRGEVFTAVYDADQAVPGERMTPAVGLPDAALGNVQKETGAGARLILRPPTDAFRARTAERASDFTVVDCPGALAGHAGRLALALGEASGSAPAPLYLRPADIRLPSP